MSKPKLSNPLGLDLDPTYYGRCKGKAKDGSACKSTTVYVNGFCKAHGGKTPAEYQEKIEQRSQELFERQKSKLLWKIERTRTRWQAHPLNASGRTIRKADSAQASTSTVNPAGQDRSASPKAQGNPVATGTAATGSRLVPGLRKAGSKPFATSSAPKPKKAESDATKTSSSAPEETQEQRNLPSPTNSPSGSPEAKTADGVEQESIARRSLRQMEGIPVSNPRSGSATPARATVSPPWHWSVVPGQAYEAWYRRQHPGRQWIEDPASVEPKSHRD